MSTGTERREGVYEDEEKGESENENAIVIGHPLADRLRQDLRKVQPYPSGTVIRFTSVSNGGIGYDYAAIFTAGHWWLTGEADFFGRKLTSEAFMNALVGRGHRIINVEIAIQFERVELSE